VDRLELAQVGAVGFGAVCEALEAPATRLGGISPRGELPGILSQAGFSAVTVFGRYRTGGGTLDLIEALR
jgi:hypothetical protein